MILIPVDESKVWPEYNQFKAIIERIIETGFWNWADMQAMEAHISGLTEGLAEAYGVSLAEYTVMLQNGKGVFVTPDMKDDLKKVFFP